MTTDWHYNLNHLTNCYFKLEYKCTNCGKFIGDTMFSIETIKKMNNIVEEENYKDRLRKERIRNIADKLISLIHYREEEDEDYWYRNEREFAEEVIELILAEDSHRV